MKNKIFLICILISGVIHANPNGGRCVKADSGIGPNYCSGRSEAICNMHDECAWISEQGACYGETPNEDKRCHGLNEERCGYSVGCTWE